MSCYCDYDERECFLRGHYLCTPEMFVEYRERASVTQPMDMTTAPKDRSILIWCAVEEQWVVGEWSDLTGWRESYPCLADEPDIISPTVWCELPAPPED